MGDESSAAMFLFYFATVWRGFSIKCFFELISERAEKQQTMISGAVSGLTLEKLVQRLESATLRLEALSSQKPTLAPKPAQNSIPPPASACKRLLITI
ncbi:unnamed protein product [Thelazia callipaeda]|uniref:Uncharacterized protein n=1 Tax=Thelazia callipaeda TaxID=103827 RepID=A0A0N5CJI1_THECL|nr:unnamed protein product [Thelazia callipaeda]